MVRVLLAEPRGHCAGVVRAIETVERALEAMRAPVFVRHEIVHNKHVVSRLRDLGATFVEGLSEIPDGAVTIFSAHGVARSVEAEAAERGLPVIDATCPLVKKVHAEVRRFAAAGRTIVIVGHAGHPEISGTLGQIDGPAFVVASVDEVTALPVPEPTPIAYVTQTTLSTDDARMVIAALQARFPDAIGPQTSDICYATQNRQAAVRRLCETAQLLLVVGSPNSSNANRLREIGLELGCPSFLVSDGSEVEVEWLESVEVVGVTAGASTPEELVQDVLTAIAALRPISIERIGTVREDMRFRLPQALDALA
jgi:4-hydroxy-3-methylbut-2-enyl diphosphate reductase